MFVKKGKYKTMTGEIAIVARVQSVGGNSWVVFGAIILTDNVYKLHAWNVEGKSFEHPLYNLLEAA